MGRFSSVDPLAEKYAGWSPYNYVLGNPMRLIDPTGGEPTDHWKGVVDNDGNVSYERIDGSGGDEIDFVYYYDSNGAELGSDLLFVNVEYSSGIEEKSPGPSR